MRSNYLKTLKTAVLAVSVLLLGASVPFAQQQVNLTAGPATIDPARRLTVPMWGYSCGAVVQVGSQLAPRCESGGDGLVTGRDHGSQRARSADQPDQQPDVSAGRITSRHRW